MQEFDLSAIASAIKAIAFLLILGGVAWYSRRSNRGITRTNIKQRTLKLQERLLVSPGVGVAVLQVGERSVAVSFSPQGVHVIEALQIPQPISNVLPMRVQV